VLVDEIDESAMVEIFDGIRLENECYLCTSLQSFAPGVRVSCEVIIVTGRAKDILLRIGVFSSFGWNGSDIDPIGDQKTAGQYKDGRTYGKSQGAHLL
jgi:hypothetical protein